MTDSLDKERLYENANARFREGDHAAAIAQIRFGVEVSPEDLNLRLALATMLAGAGRLAEAETELRTIITQTNAEPHDFFTHMPLAQLLLRQGKFEEAETAFRALMEPAIDYRLNEGLSCALFYRGQRARMADKEKFYEEAAEHAEKAMQLSADLKSAGRLQFNIGRIAFFRGVNAHYSGEDERKMSFFREAKPLLHASTFFKEANCEIAHEYLAVIDTALGLHESALDHATHAYEWASKLDDPDILQQAERILIAARAKQSMEDYGISGFAM